MIAEKRRRFSVWQNDIRNSVKKHQYHEVKSKVQCRVREMENNWWVRKAHEIQALYLISTTAKPSLQPLKRIYGPTFQDARAVAGKDRILRKDLTGIEDRWKESDLLNQTTSVNNDAIMNMPQSSVKTHLEEPPTLDCYIYRCDEEGPSYRP